MRVSRSILLLGAAAAVHLAAQGSMGGTPTTGNGGQTSVQANPNFGSGGGIHGMDSTRPVSFSGKVAIEDGSAVPPSIAIQRVCGGIPKTVAYTDSKGRFSFAWGDRGMVVADAAEAGSGTTRNASPSGFGSAQSAGGANPLATDPFGNRMMNCVLRAYLAGFTSETVDLFNRRSNDTPDIGVILLHRMAGVSGSSISATSLTAPKDAKKAYERGLQSALKNKPADAAKDFEKAVALYPRYADAWVELGRARLEQQQVGPAREAMLKAIDADPKLVAPYMELGLLAAKDAKWVDSGKFLDRAVELDPVDFPQAWYADAVANYNLQKYDEAEKSARAAVKLDPRHVNPRSDYLLGLVLAEKKDYAGAAAELSLYLKLSPNAPDLALVKGQLGEIEKHMEKQ